jgi:hypothetical protein
MDYLVMGTCVLDKKEQEPWPETDEWKEEFELD